MKRIVAFITAVASVVMLGACSNSDDSSQTSKTETVESSSAVVDSSSAADSVSEDLPPEIEVESCKLEDENFSRYTSNTFISTGNNGLVKSADEVTYRVYLPVEEYGTLEYCFYFSNTVDSTYNRGNPVYAGREGGEYKIISASISDGGESVDDKIKNTTEITFGGETSKDVEPSETFWSDPITFEVPEGHYLVWEWTLTGENIPCNNTSNLTDGKSSEYDEDFVYCDNIPLPQFIGADRENVKTRVTAIGDSITQGCQTEYMKYEFWAARVSKGLDESSSFYNCGLGWARSSDLANYGNWLGRALNSDVVILAFGTNDIASGEVYGDGGNTAEEIDGFYRQILDQLKLSDCKTIIFSAPPEDFEDANESTRIALNEKLKATAEEYGAEYFDFASYLCDPETPSVAKYGGHPNGEGGKIVADALLEQFADIL